MRKTCKRTMIFLLAIVLTSLLVLTAFARSWSSAGKFSGDGYHGNYSASVDVTPESATIRLSVSDYIGPEVLEGGVSCEVTEHYTNTQFSVTQNLSAPNSSSHTWTILPTNQKTYSYIECEFYYMGSPIVSIPVTAS